MQVMLCEGKKKKKNSQEKRSQQIYPLKVPIIQYFMMNTAFFCLQCLRLLNREELLQYFPVQHIYWR